MLKRQFKIVNLKPTFLDVPTKSRSVPVGALGQSGLFAETELCPELSRMVSRGLVRLEFVETPLGDSAKSGRIEIKKETT